MARENTGGKSVKLDVTISPELYAAVEKHMKRKKIASDSQAVRIALAAMVGKPDLAEMPSRGRPKKPD